MSAVSRCTALPRGVRRGGGHFGYEAKDWAGVALDEQGITHPFAYVKKDTKPLQLTADNKLKATKSVERRTFLDLTEETEIAGRVYMISCRRPARAQGSPAHPRLAAGAEGTLIRGSGGSTSGVSQQLLSPTRGRARIRHAGVDRARRGRRKTPTRRRAVAGGLQQARDDDDGRQLGADGPYSSKTCPGSCTSQGSYALHGAFWHGHFGDAAEPRLREPGAERRAVAVPTGRRRFRPRGGPAPTPRAKAASSSGTATARRSAPGSRSRGSAPARSSGARTRRAARSYPSRTWSMGHPGSSSYRRSPSCRPSSSTRACCRSASDRAAVPRRGPPSTPSRPVDTSVTYTGRAPS